MKAHLQIKKNEIRMEPGIAQWHAPSPIQTLHNWCQATGITLGFTFRNEQDDKGRYVWHITLHLRPSRTTPHMFHETISFNGAGTSKKQAKTAAAINALEFINSRITLPTGSRAFTALAPTFTPLEKTRAMSTSDMDTLDLRVAFPASATDLRNSFYREVAALARRYNAELVFPQLKPRLGGTSMR